MKKKGKTIKAAFQATIPVLLGYLVTGTAMGVLSQKAGFAWWLPLLMAVIMYAGAGQFLAVELFTLGASPFTLVLMTFLLNARHMVYGLTFLDRMDSTWKNHKFLRIHLLTDESYAILMQANAHDPAQKGLFDFCVILFNYGYWIMGCGMGAFIGNLIPFSMKGLDFSLTALFLVTAVEQWRTSPSHLPAILGFLCGAGMLLGFGASQFMLPSILLLLGLLLLLRPYLEGAERGKFS